MKTYIGTVKLFNGKYWRSTEARVQASSLRVAIGKAIRTAPKKSRERIEGASVLLTVVKGSGVRIVDDSDGAS